MTNCGVINFGRAGFVSIQVGGLGAGYGYVNILRSIITVRTCPTTEDTSPAVSTYIKIVGYSAVQNGIVGVFIVGAQAGAVANGKAGRAVFHIIKIAAIAIPSNPGIRAGYI